MATRSEDPHSEGRHQHHTRAIAARVFSRNPAPADGSAGHPEASASCPPKTSARLEASAAQLRRRFRQRTTRPGSDRPHLLEQEIQNPISINEIARLVGNDTALASNVYLAARLVSKDLSRKEIIFLADLAQALGLDDALVEQLEKQAGF